ncbi:AraC family transcriptional regulator [Niabella sp.]|uniref:helix-turn-helix domain-containing protein n=1 Tax=Niabella sp. TaxID=1962976 RepID=UPI0026216892|nr:AraC family transcriptional regulator [Niabella sp.]
MSIQFLLYDNIALEPENEVPHAFGTPLINGATFKFFRKEANQILVQEVDEIDFRYRIISGNLSCKMTAVGNLSERGIYITLMLANGTIKEVSNFGKFPLYSNSYLIIYGGNNSYTYFVKKPGTFEILDVFLSTALLKQLQGIYPQLKDIIRTSEDKVLRHRLKRIPSAVLKIWQQIRNLPDGEAARQFYLELKIKEFLFILLQSTFIEEQEATKFTNFEISMIHKAKEILEKRVEKKAPSTKELSRMVGINEVKLKQGFKRFFDRSVYKWITDQRMLKAKEFILTTDRTIKEIAALTGFPLTSNFVHAFRKRFGVPPGALRR